MDKKIGIIGLGYVGLPLAIAFAEKYSVIGFDVNSKRIADLENALDHTLESSEEELKAVLVQQLEDDNGKGLFVTAEPSHLADCNIYIITVPTPVDEFNVPDLTPLEKATELVAKYLQKREMVIYESTVFPGCTEEVCVPILEKISGLAFNTDFFCGYSPERINPGDKERTVKKIRKITSGSTTDAAKEIDALYASVITAGTYLASSIKVAESAKVIENAQRDINIAFVNELAKIFNLLNIDTKEVLAAAGTKWNFLPFQPGLVGGHCIGVDPYYLAQKAQAVGYHPEIILAGRRVNDGMGAYVANELIKLMLQKKINVQESKVLVLGITFKENCTDVRNTKVVDIVRELEKYHVQVTVCDPWASSEASEHEYGIRCVSSIPEGVQFDGIIAAVAHEQFSILNHRSHLTRNGILYDVKGTIDPSLVDARL
jgi:UDP-N-acetyl-D-galactosamine dehydrogenase